MKPMKAINQTSDIQSISLDELYPIVETKEWILDKLRQSIDKEGMRDPIVVARITVREWVEDDNPHIMSPPKDLGLEEYVYRIQRGHNRVTIAREYGFDAIDCLVFDNIHSACVISDQVRIKNKKWISDINK